MTNQIMKESYSKWMVFDEKGVFQSVRTLTHNGSSHYKELYDFEIGLRKQVLYAHELWQIDLPYLRGQKLIDKLSVLGWEFGDDGLIVDKGHSLISKSRERLSGLQIDTAMSFAFDLWAKNKDDKALYENVKTILLVLRREKYVANKRDATRQEIRERAKSFRTAHHTEVMAYKAVAAQKRKIGKKKQQEDPA